MGVNLAMYLLHTTSNVKIKVLGGLHRLWCLLFGFFYYLAKGMWGWAIISFFTLNGLLVGFPLFNRSIVRNHHINAGWREENTQK